MLDIIGALCIIFILMADCYISQYKGDFSVDIFKFWTLKYW